MLKSLLFCAGILLFVLCIRFPVPFSDQFLVRDISESYAPFVCPELEQVLSKPLTYLGNGLQAAAFVSQDDQYVVKFFLKQKLRKKIRIRLPTLHPKKPLDQKYQRTDILRRYHDAFLKLKEETGLIAVHLHATYEKLPQCILIDHVGKKHEIDLHRVSFVIQKKGKTIPNALKDNPRKKIASLRALFKKIASKGFANLAKNFNPKNFAFIGDEAIMIDLGRVVLANNRDSLEETQRLQELFNSWVHAQKLTIKI